MSKGPLGESFLYQFFIGGDAKVWRPTTASRDEVLAFIDSATVSGTMVALGHLAVGSHLLGLQELQPWQHQVVGGR